MQGHPVQLNPLRRIFNQRAASPTLHPPKYYKLAMAQGRFKMF